MEQLNSSNLLQEEVDLIIKNTSSLRELTYAYTDLWEGRQFNETIFIDYLWLPDQLKNPKTLSFYLKDSKFISRTLNKTRKKILYDINILQEYLKSCDNDERNQIEMLIIALEFTNEALEFEWEVAWYDNWMSDTEIEEKTRKLYELDAIMFWEHISENSDFMKEIYSYLSYLYDNFWDWLSSDEKKEIILGLDVIWKQLITLTWDAGVLEGIDVFIPEQESEDFKRLKNIEISRDDYMQIFDAFFSVSWVTQRSKEWNFGSFYDGDDFYGIPSNKWYDTKTLEELLKLAPHEAWHYINLKVTQDRGEVKRPGDMEKEEWLAKITEKLISGVSLEWIQAITFSAPSVWLSRLLNWEQFLNFQNAYGTLLEKAWVHSKKRDFIKEFLRKKRWFSKKLPWWSNKDASYSLWLFSVLQYIRIKKLE